MISQSSQPPPLQRSALKEIFPLPNARGYLRGRKTAAAIKGTLADGVQPLANDLRRCQTSAVTKGGWPDIRHSLGNRHPLQIDAASKGGLANGI